MKNVASGEIPWENEWLSGVATTARVPRQLPLGCRAEAGAGLATGR
jgi:hypothetical protein